MSEQHPDRGFSLIEVLLVILVIGLLSAVVVTSVGGTRAEADEAGCAADARHLATAAEAYFADRAMRVIPPADPTPDGYELTLVAEGFLRNPSSLHDLDGFGAVIAVPGRCD